MAITLAAFQTALDNLVTSIGSGDYNNAWLYYAQAAAILTGLEESISDRGQSISRRKNLSDLKAAIEAAQAQAATNSSDGRFIKTRMGTD